LSAGEKKDVGRAADPKVRLAKPSIGGGQRETLKRAATITGRADFL